MHIIETYEPQHADPNDPVSCDRCGRDDGETRINAIHTGRYCDEHIEEIAATEDGPGEQLLNRYPTVNFYA